MTTLAENRALARAEHRIALLERDLLFVRDRYERCYSRSILLERLVRSQSALLVGLRDRNPKQIGKSMEEMVRLKKQLRHLHDHG